MMQLVRLACSKLITPTPYTSNRCQTYNSLAILSQRLDLRIALGHQEAAAFIDDAIANHLRICLGTPEDRRWRSTSSGSEPFLSHVAAVLLERDSSVFGALQETLRSGLIEREDGGGLACRALLLVGKDVCLRTRYNKRFGVEPTLDHELFYCRPISVLAYLETLFGPRIYPAGEVAKAGVQEDFKNARVNFLHWNSMSENIHTSTHEDWEYVLRPSPKSFSLDICHIAARNGCSVIMHAHLLSNAATARNSSTKLFPYTSTRPTGLLAPWTECCSSWYPTGSRRTAIALTSTPYCAATDRSSASRRSRRSLYSWMQAYECQKPRLRTTLTWS